MSQSLTFRSDMDCRIVQHMGSDAGVVQAMLVSTRGLTNEEASLTSMKGRINFLMKNRHGTPFEHNSFTFAISTPIFVIRELHRHRIGFSFNEESARYKPLDPVFYIPARERKLIRVGKAGAYQMEPGTDDQYKFVCSAIMNSSRDAYRRYSAMLDEGIAPEVARMVLPVNIYSSQYVTCNARSLMAFLSLRQEHTAEEAQFPSRPLKEINMLADMMEEFFATSMPITHTAFVSNGYVAP